MSHIRHHACPILRDVWWWCVVSYILDTTETELPRARASGGTRRATTSACVPTSLGRRLRIATARIGGTSGAPPRASRANLEREWGAWRRVESANGAPPSREGSFWRLAASSTRDSSLLPPRGGVLLPTEHEAGPFHRRLPDPIQDFAERPTRVGFEVVAFRFERIDHRSGVVCLFEWWCDRRTEPGRRRGDREERKTTHASANAAGSGHDHAKKPRQPKSRVARASWPGGNAVAKKPLAPATVPSGGELTASAPLSEGARAGEPPPEKRVTRRVWFQLRSRGSNQIVSYNIMEWNGLYCTGLDWTVL